MTARGKREAKRARRPWVRPQNRGQGLKGRNNRRRIPPFQDWCDFLFCYQGRRARFASHLPLAIIFRAFGAACELLRAP